MGLVAFLVEILILCLAKPGYFKWPETFDRSPHESRKAYLKRCLTIGSFFFYLDIFGTLAMLGELSWVMGNDPNEVAEQAAIRAGRAGRIARLMRLIRLLKLDRTLHLLIQRIIKLFESPMTVVTDDPSNANVTKDTLDTSIHSAADSGTFGDDYAYSE